MKHIYLVLSEPGYRIVLRCVSETETHVSVSEGFVLDTSCGTKAVDYSVDTEAITISVPIALRTEWTF
jgi:hypothetical protein